MIKVGIVYFEHFIEYYSVLLSIGVGTLPRITHKNQNFSPRI